MAVPADIPPIVAEAKFVPALEAWRSARPLPGGLMVGPDAGSYPYLAQGGEVLQVAQAGQLGWNHSTDTGPEPGSAAAHAAAMWEHAKRLDDAAAEAHRAAVEQREREFVQKYGPPARVLKPDVSIEQLKGRAPPNPARELGDHPLLHGASAESALRPETAAAMEGADGRGVSYEATYTGQHALKGDGAQPGRFDLEIDD